MKKTIALLMGLILSASALTACSDPSEFSKKEQLSVDYTRSTDPTENYNYNDGAITPLSYNNYANTVTNFELKMFRNYYSLQEDKNASFVFSPINTTLQLGLLANGASGDTKSEIVLAMGGGDLSLDEINKCSSYFKSRMEAVSKTGDNEVDELSGKKAEETVDEYVKFDNNLIFNDTSDVKTSFLQKNANFYGSNIFRVMFSDENALTKINNHFSSYSNESIVSELDENNTLISMTATDISDLWLDPYTKEDLEKGKFKASSGEREVDFMKSNERYISTEKAEGVIKYTSKNPLKFVFVMPKNDVSLENYIKDFNNLEYANLLDSMDITTKTTSKIPQFSIESKKAPSTLSETLSKCGLYTLFTEEATFADMTHSNDFWLNEMYDITPAISVGAAGVGGTNGLNGKTVSDNRVKELEKTEKSIEFNRPFIFLVIDNETNIPVYIGAVNNI